MFGRPLFLFIMIISKLFYVSTFPDLEKEVLNPTIPNNKLSIDNKLPRISLFKSIDQALMSMSPKNLISTTLYVYRPLGLFSESLIKPGIDKIPESIFTEELWYLRPLRFKLVKEIEVTGLKDIKKFKYGPRSLEGKLNVLSWTEKLKPWEKKKL